MCIGDRLLHQRADRVPERLRSRGSQPGGFDTGGHAGDGEGPASGVKAFCRVRAMDNERKPRREAVPYTYLNLPTSSHE